jgi:hypothetical protein
MKQEETAGRGRRREEKKEKRKKEREEKYGNFSKLENFCKIEDNL